MTVSRELLWMAYPEGLLDVRGVRTVGGWERTQYGWNAPTDYVHQTVAEVLSIEDLVEIIKGGELLPLLEPFHDVATWNCAMHEFAHAAATHPFDAEHKLSHIPPIPWQLTWRLTARGWVLEVHSGSTLVNVARATFEGLQAEPDNPAAALAMARARLHKALAMARAQPQGESQ